MDEIEISLNNNDIDIDTDSSNSDNEVLVRSSEVVKVVSSNYEDLQNKPQINGVTLTGNKTLNSLGIPEFNYNSTTETLTITLV